MKSIKAMNRLITQVTLIVFAIVGLLLVFPPMADAGNRLVARSCDHGTVAAIVAPTYAYTAPSTCNNAPLQQRELGDATYDQCPQAAAAIAYPEVQRYTLVPQVSRYAQVQRVQTPYAQRVLFLNDNHHSHHHHNNAQQFRQVQRLNNQAHHHNQQANRQNQRLQNQAHHTAQFRLAQNNGSRRTVTKTVQRSSRR